MKRKPLYLPGRNFGLFLLLVVTAGTASRWWQHHSAPSPSLSITVFEEPLSPEPLSPELAPAEPSPAQRPLPSPPPALPHP